MAVDTANKRYSLIGFGAPIPRLLPIPDGAVGGSDRAMLLFLYHGYALGAAILAVDYTVSADVEVRFTATADIAMRFTASEDVEL